MPTILRDDGLAALVGDAPMATIAEGLQFTEGPLWLPDGSILFQDIKAERTYRVDAAGVVSTLRDQTGAANGQTFGPDGRVVFCEQNGRRVSTMGLDGSGVGTLVQAWEGRRLNSPNDIITRSDGLILFTDPPYGVRPEDREIDFQGVYALDDAGLRPLVRDFEKPNGLALSPDEKILYVCDTARYHVRAFDVSTDGGLANGRTFATMDPGAPGGPDGMKVDAGGRVYVAVALGVWVYEPSGRLLGILATPKRPSNLAWAGPDADELVITAVDAVHRLPMRVRGCPPPRRPTG